MPDPLHIDVLGAPQPQGSKKGFVVKGTRRVVIVDDNPESLKAWRTEVATAARNTMGRAEPLAGPVVVGCAFYIPRPKYHYRTGRFAELLRPDAPLYCTTKPDVDKLLRAILDALTGVCYTDDSQVVGIGPTTKLYANGPAGVRIALLQLEGA